MVAARHGVVGLDLERSLDELLGFLVFLPGEAILRGQRQKQIVLGAADLDRAAARTGQHGARKLAHIERAQFRGNLGYDRVARGKQIVGRPLVALAPELIAVFGGDELGRDLQPVAFLAHHALDNEARAEFARRVLHVDGLALVGEHRLARDDRLIAKA